MKYHDFDDDQPKCILTYHGLPIGSSKEELERALISIMEYGIAHVDSTITVARLKTRSTATNCKSTAMNCKNCGAPMKGHICEYCGSEYQY